MRTEEDARDRGGGGGSLVRLNIGNEYTTQAWVLMAIAVSK